MPSREVVDTTDDREEDEDRCDKIVQRFGINLQDVNYDRQHETNPNEWICNFYLPINKCTYVDHSTSNIYNEESC